MRIITKIWLVLLAAALTQGVALASSFTLSLDRDTMTLGDEVTLTLVFTDVQPQSAPELPHIPGLQFQYQSEESSSSMINSSHISRTKTFTYVVTAEREGKFTIPALQALVGNEKLVCQPAKLVVTKSDAPPTGDAAAGNEPAFMKLKVPKNKVYVGEPMVAYLELYFRDDVQGSRDFQTTSSPSDGFNAGKMAEQQGMRHRTQIGNRAYTVYELALPLTAVRAGTLTVGPFMASVVVGFISQRQNHNPFFPFMNPTEEKQVSLATEAVKVESLALPEQNKPANFSGAVGDFTMSATAGPTTVTVGDPITVRVQITGSGALDSVTLPVQDAWHDFKTYPATTKQDNSDAFGFQGTKTFEQIVSPENADVHTLPAMSFSFFSPDDGQYHTDTQAAVPLVVKAAGGAPVPSLTTTKNAATENQPAQDIGPIKENLGALAKNAQPLVVQPVFLVVQSVPVLAFLAALMWRKNADSLANNPRLRRRRAVAQMMGSGLADLKKHAAANQPDEFFATLFRLLQEQLGERLDCPASAITENVVEEHAWLRNAPDAVKHALREQFQLCNQARYAPVRGTSELNSVAAQFEKLINQLLELKA